MPKDNEYWKKLRPVLNESQTALEDLISYCQIVGENSCLPVDRETMKNAVQIVVITLRKHKKIHGEEYVNEILKERIVTLPSLSKDVGLEEL